jgi:hypothetical protein
MGRARSVKIIRTLVLTPTLAGLLFACSTAPAPRGLGEAPVFERGFQIFPSPRTFDPPGTIFRVDSDQARQAVADLSAMLRVVPHEEAIPKVSLSGLLNTSAFLSWLSGEKRGFQYQRIDSATVAVIGAKREQAFEVELDKLLDSARRIIDWKKPGKVYLITETVLADSIQVRLSTSAGVLIGDSLKADSARAHGISVQWKPQRTTEISLRFPKPYRVLYKAQQVLRPEGFEQYPNRPLVRVPIVESLAWKER